METNHEAIEKSHGTLARERARQDLKNLTRDAEELLKATAGDVSEKAKEARSRVAAPLERAKTTRVHLGTDGRHGQGSDEKGGCRHPRAPV